MAHISEENQRYWYSYGRKGFGACVIALGFTTLLFGDESEFKNNYLFWKYAAGYWQVEGPNTANQESYFQYWLMLMALSLLFAGLLMFSKNPWGPLLCSIVLFFRGLHHANPAFSVLLPDRAFAGQSWVHFSQFIAMFGGCLLVLSKGEDETSSSIRIDSPFKRKRQSFLAEQRQNPNRTT
jgi:hypothetical protein